MSTELWSQIIDLKAHFISGLAEAIGFSTAVPKLPQSAETKLQSKYSRFHISIFFE